MPLSELLESRYRELQTELADARRTIDVLRQSEEKFRRILASVPDVTWTSDQYGRTTYISPKVEAAFGYTQQEIYANDELWLGRIHPDDVGRVVLAYRALFESQSVFDEEYRVRRKDEAWIWVHDRAICTHEESGVLYADGIFCDVTARKLAEEELWSKTAFLEAQADSTIDGVLVVDERGQRILQNQRLVELFKIPAEILEDPDDRRMLGFVVATIKNAKAFLARVQYLYSHPNETSRDELELKDGTILDRYSSPSSIKMANTTDGFGPFGTSPIASGTRTRCSSCRWRWSRARFQWSSPTPGERSAM
jgi:PAS domain S-box-containing protein